MPFLYKLCLAVLLDTLFFLMCSVPSVYFLPSHDVKLHLTTVRKIDGSCRSTQKNWHLCLGNYMCLHTPGLLVESSAMWMNLTTCTLPLRKRVMPCSWCRWSFRVCFESYLMEAIIMVYWGIIATICFSCIICKIMKCQKMTFYSEA